MVTLKAAISLDGRIASGAGIGRWISGEAARLWTHRIRAEHDAILVGSGTVLADDPELTCRLPGLSDRSPVRVVLDRRLRLPLDSQLVRSAREHAVWVLTRSSVDSPRARQLEASGVRIEALPPEAEGRLQDALALLAERGITRLLVEGGRQTATAFLTAGFVDRLILFQAPIFLGEEAIPVVGGLGIRSPEAAARLALVEERRVSSDRMLVFEPIRDEGCSPES
jgi:diaminohydroxyphosphoribosylaminopyrimidine deaminase/5-amino-6-(5-phosphoribosylamino)uracil reductase